MPPARDLPPLLDDARAALASADLAGAIKPLALACVVDPFDSAVKDAISQWALAAGARADSLFEGQPEGIPAPLMHSRVWWLQGKAEDALLQLCAYTYSSSTLVALEAWTFEWLSSDVGLEAVHPIQAQYLIETVLFRIPDARQGQEPWQREVLEQGLAVLRRLRDFVPLRSPDADSPTLVVFHRGGQASRPIGEDEEVEFDKLENIALSKLGRFAEAIAHARSVYRSAPSWQNAITVANALRRSGDLRGALGMFEQALGHRPGDLATRLDLGDLHLELEEVPAALRCYEEVLEQASHHSWALPSAHYCRFRITGDRAWLSRLEELGQDKPQCTCGQHGVLALLTGDDAGDIRDRASDLLRWERTRTGGS